METHKTHPHADLIKAWADGAKIQSRHLIDFDNVEQWSKWTDDGEPDWCDEDYQFRIKPDEPSNEPWKPKKDDWYHVVGMKGCVVKIRWTNNEQDNELYEAHNCFRTREEAEAAAERVKAALTGELKISAPNTENFQLDGKPLTDGEKALIRAIRLANVSDVHERGSILVVMDANGQRALYSTVAFSTAGNSALDETIRAALKRIKQEQEENK